MNSYIPLSVPNLSGNEWKYVKECLDTGWVSSAGPYVNRFEDEFRKAVGAKHAVACSSGTAALHIAFQLAGVGPGDLVLAPTVTFIASINAIRYVGAEPYFFDSDSFYNVDAEQLVKFLQTETVAKGNQRIHTATGKKIGAVMAVHVFGNAADIFSIANICEEMNIPLIEDAAESLGTIYNEAAPAKFKKRHTGTIGKIGCFSFNGNKIMTTGGGGMIVTNDPAIAHKAKYLTTQSKDDELYFVHNEIGYNYRMTNVQAAMGVAQLEQLEKFLETKRSNFRYYKEKLSNVPGLSIANVPPYADNNHWLTCVQVDKNKFGRNRDDLLKIFRQEKIEARPLWHLNHLQKPFENCGKANMVNSLKQLAATVNIPSSTNLKTADLDRVIGVLNEK